MRRPWMYDRLTLPHKLPPPPGDFDVGSLPIVGYLEQTLARTLADSLTVVAKVRPRFPYLGVKESALKYLALHLRANDPTNKKNAVVAAKTKKLFKEFDEYCHLTSFIMKHSPLVNPHVWHSSASQARYNRAAEKFDGVKSLDLTHFLDSV